MTEGGVRMSEQGVMTMPDGLEKLSGSVETVIYSNEENGYIPSVACYAVELTA